MAKDPAQDAINRAAKTEVTWVPRTTDPPPGLIWVTDGQLVWLVYTDGKIPEDAVLVRAWTSPVIIPQPPKELPR